MKSIILAISILANCLFTINAHAQESSQIIKAGQSFTIPEGSKGTITSVGLFANAVEYAYVVLPTTVNVTAVPIRIKIGTLSIGSTTIETDSPGLVLTGPVTIQVNQINDSLNEIFGVNSNNSPPYIQIVRKVISGSAPLQTPFVGLLVKSNATPTTIPNNSIVIPSSQTGVVNVQLESSVDLVNWIPISPGAYSGGTSARFFRVKAQATNP
jgi:hypothetical protein